MDLAADGRLFLTVSTADRRGQPSVRLSVWRRAPRAGTGPLTDFPAGTHVDIPLDGVCDVIALLAADTARERWCTLPAWTVDPDAAAPNRAHGGGVPSPTRACS